MNYPYHPCVLNDLKQPISKPTSSENISSELTPPVIDVKQPSDTKAVVRDASNTVTNDRRGSNSADRSANNLQPSANNQVPSMNNMDRSTNDLGQSSTNMNQASKLITSTLINSISRTDGSTPSQLRSSSIGGSTGGNIPDKNSLTPAGIASAVSSDINKSNLPTAPQSFTKSATLDPVQAVTHAGGSRHAPEDTPTEVVQADLPEDEGNASPNEQDDDPSKKKGKKKGKTVRSASEEEKRRRKKEKRDRKEKDNKG